MRTVKWLKNELSKFPDEAVCFAYEGEVSGIVIEDPRGPKFPQGIIYCSERHDHQRESDLLQVTP